MEAKGNVPDQEANIREQQDPSDDTEDSPEGINHTESCSQYGAHYRYTLFTNKHVITGLGFSLMAKDEPEHQLGRC